MLEYLKQEANLTHTENGAVTYLSTTSDLLDLFASVGGLREAPERELTDRFIRAYAEAPDLAMKLLFFARDVRGGLGERRFFRVILRYLGDAFPDSVRRNLAAVPELGRWDDLLCLFGTACEADAIGLIKQQLALDIAAAGRGESVSLLAKWLPSVNASAAQTVSHAKTLARALGLTDRAYRKLLADLRRRAGLLENHLRERDYSFDYAKQPSQALLKYRQAFRRNDGPRYAAFMEAVRAGRAKLHTGTLTPYEIIRPFYTGKPDPSECAALDVTWNAQEDFTRGENALVVADGSGSMYTRTNPSPAAVAQSLAIYFAERNRGVFHNHFITFSENARLVEIKGADIAQKVRYCRSFNEIANTNIQKVFDLILDTALRHGLPQSELPTRLYIISDMEFDVCAKGASLTNFAAAKAAYEAAGYRLPQVVFWNVACRNRNLPVTKNEQGVALVSGSSPQLFRLLREGTLEPMAFLLECLGDPRYEAIQA